MQKLAKREEQIMQACWHLGKAFIKEIITELPDPKPHYNSVATMVRILEEKGFLAHETLATLSAIIPPSPRNSIKNTPLVTSSGNTSITPIQVCWPISPKSKRCHRKNSMKY